MTKFWTRNRVARIAAIAAVLLAIAFTGTEVRSGIALGFLCAWVPWHLDLFVKS